VSADKNRLQRQQTTAALFFGRLDQDSLYVVGGAPEMDRLWALASGQASARDCVGDVDGFRVIAPGLAALGACSDVVAPGQELRRRLETPRPLGRIALSAPGADADALILGWAAPEPLGAWSLDDAACILTTLPAAPDADIELRVEAHAFLASKHPVQEVELLVNGATLATWTYDESSNERPRAVVIPKDLIARYDNRVMLLFNFKNAISPDALNLAADKRRLGLRIVALELRPATVSP